MSEKEKNEDNENSELIKSEEEYGESFKEHLLDQYKLYIEMTDRISERRAQTNKFYITLLSILFSFPSLLLIVPLSSEFQIDFQKILLLGISIIGIGLCLWWIINIRSYRQLNKVRFDNIAAIEEYLPCSFYKEEWKKLGGGKKWNLYFQLTTIEMFIPLFLLIPYMILFIYTILLLS
jgi:hypothetical protein